MVASTTLQYAAFAGILAGVLARTFVPYYLKKVVAGEKITFSPQYIGTAFVSVLTAYGTAQALFATFSLADDVTGILGALGAGFVFSGAINHIVNTVFADYGTPTGGSGPPPVA